MANVYLQYVFDLWAKWWRKRHAHGDVIIVRFADDFIAGFEHQADAQRFLADLRERFAKFGLDLHEGKTRLIEFGRHAARRRKARGLGKPETFDFLGFTHICGKTRDGRFGLRRVTISKRMRAKLHELKDELMRRRHQPVPEQGRRGARALRLLRRARQQQGDQGIPDPGDPALAPGAAAPQPADPPELGTHGPPRHPVAAPGPDHAPMAERAIRRSYPRQEPSLRDSTPGR
jgi:Reverse transcriptase (RNA-dependent DNA polymerase)